MKPYFPLRESSKAPSSWIHRDLNVRILEGSDGCLCSRLAPPVRSPSPGSSLMLQCWRRTGHLPSFFVPPRDIWQFNSPHPREFAIQGQKKKMLMPGGQPGGWGFWAQMELTDASQRRQQVNWVWIRPILIEFMERFLSRYSRSGFPFRRQE